MKRTEEFVVDLISIRHATAITEGNSQTRRTALGDALSRQNATRKMGEKLVIPDEHPQLLLDAVTDFCESHKKGELSEASVLGFLGVVKFFTTVLERELDVTDDDVVIKTMMLMAEKQS